MVWIEIEKGGLCKKRFVKEAYKKEDYLPIIVHPPNREERPGNEAEGSGGRKEEVDGVDQL